MGVITAEPPYHAKYGSTHPRNTVQKLGTRMMYNMSARVEGQCHTVQGLEAENTELGVNEIANDVQY